MEFYPYDLYVASSTDLGFDDNGFAKEDEVGFHFHSKCRDYPSGAGTIVNTETKEIVNHSSVIMLPLTCEEVKANTLIQVKDKSNKTRLSARVIRFERNQLHCRIWV